MCWSIWDWYACGCDVGGYKGVKSLGVVIMREACVRLRY
jgi:hypothetical protein